MFPRHLSTVAFSSLVLVGASVTCVSNARAEDSAARALFKEGRALASEGKYSEACPKFEASLRLEVGVGTQFNLADCWEHIGRVASAQKLFRGAAASAKAAGQTDREQVLRERAAALEPRVPKLVIDVGDDSPRLVVKRDDLPLDRDEWGQAVAVDPGTYQLSAKAPGKKPWRRTVEVKSGVAVVSVEVPKLELAAQPQAKPVTPVPQHNPANEPAKAPPSTARAPSTPPVTDRRGPPNYRAFTLLGVGLTGVLVGSVMGLRYSTKNGEAKDTCPSSVNCSPDEILRHGRLVDEASSARTWMFVGSAVGVASLAGAVFFFATDKPRGERAARFRAAPLLGQHELGASLAGSF